MDLLVCAMLFQHVSPLVIVHLERVEQRAVLALIFGIHVCPVVNEKLNHAAVLQVQCCIENRIAVCVGLNSRWHPCR